MKPLVRLVPLLSWHIKVRLPSLCVGAEANQMSKIVGINRPPHTMFANFYLWVFHNCPIIQICPSCETLFPLDGDVIYFAKYIIDIKERMPFTIGHLAQPSATFILNIALLKGRPSFFGNSSDKI